MRLSINNKDISNSHYFTGGVRIAAYKQISNHEIFFMAPNPNLIKNLDNFLLKHSVVAYKDCNSLSIPLIGYSNSYINSMSSFKGSMKKLTNSKNLELRITSSKQTQKLLKEFFIKHDITALVIAPDTISVILD